MNKYPRVRIENIVLQNVANETLVYDIKSNRAHCLNESSALIWKMCDGKTSVSEMAAQLSKQLKAVITEEYVSVAVDQLKRENLLDNADEIQSGYKGLSRRDVIRRVGMTSIIALPMISAVVAPSSVSAQSCLAIGVNVGGTIACPAGPTACSCATVIGGPGAAACCTGVVVPDNCVPIPNTTAQQCGCVCGVIIP